MSAESHRIARRARIAQDRAHRAARDARQLAARAPRRRDDERETRDELAAARVTFGARA